MDNLKSRLEAKRDAKAARVKEFYGIAESAGVEIGANEFIPMIVELALALKGISRGDIVNPHDRAKSAIDKLDEWLGGE